MSCSSCPPKKKKNKIVRVATGFAYLAAGVNNDLSEQRVKICYNCPRLVGGLICGICGCEVHAKTRLPQEQCPDKPPKWLAQVQVKDLPTAPSSMQETVDIPYEEVKPKELNP